MKLTNCLGNFTARLQPLWLVALLTLLSANNAFASDVNINDPFKLVETVAMRTFDRIKANQDVIKDDHDLMRTIIEEELLPHTDFQFAAFMVLGRFFRTVPKDKLNEYVSVFREYLITTYSVAMGYYDNQTVIFEPSSDFSDKKTVTVRAIIKDPVRPDIRIAFKVRQDNRTNQWKAYDMVAEGISLLNSTRSEFEEILRQEGIDAVIALMRRKIASPTDIEFIPEETAALL